MQVTIRHSRSFGLKASPCPPRAPNKAINTVRLQHHTHKYSHPFALLSSGEQYIRTGAAIQEEAPGDTVYLQLREVLYIMGTNTWRDGKMRWLLRPSCCFR